MNRFQSHLLTFARLFWLAFLVFKWVYWVASMPRFFALVNAGAIPTVVTSGGVQVSPELFAAAAAVWGVSVPTWAVLNTLINILSAVVFTLTAALVAWRLRTWFGWLTAMVLLVGGSNVQSHVIRTAMIWPPAYFIWTVGALIWPLLVLWLYLFPNGRPVPRRLLWILGPLLALFTSFFFAILTTEMFPAWTAVASLIPFRLSGLLRDARFLGNRICGPYDATTNSACPDSAVLTAFWHVNRATVIADRPALPLKAGEPAIPNMSQTTMSL